MRGAIRVVLAVAGLVAIVLGIVYFTVPAGSLPLPDVLGHQGGSPVIHVKHGIAAVLVGFVCWVLSWGMGPSRR